MFAISKILPLLLLPPGLFLLLAVLALVLIQRGRGRAAITTLAGLVVLAYLLSIEPVSDALLLPLEERFPPAPLPALQPSSCGVILLLGGGIKPSSPDAEGRSVPGADSMARTLAAWRLWRRTGAPLLISGYAERPGLPSAAQVMAEALRTLGVPGRSIVLESEARNTFENARNSAAILRERGWVRSCLVTSAYHMPRAMLAFGYFQVRPLPLPTHYLAVRGPYIWRSYLPGMGALARSRTALREYLGLLFYRSFYRPSGSG